MFISINSPPVVDFNPRSHVKYMVIRPSIYIKQWNGALKKSTRHNPQKFVQKLIQLLGLIDLSIGFS